MLPQNFHLMDYHLAIFITVMLARRLVWTIVSEVNTQTCTCQLIHLSTQMGIKLHWGQRWRRSISGSCELILSSVSSRCLRAAVGRCSATCFWSQLGSACSPCVAGCSAGRWSTSARTTLCLTCSSWDTREFLIPPQSSPSKSHVMHVHVVFWPCVKVF